MRYGKWKHTVKGIDRNEFQEITKQAKEVASSRNIPLDNVKMTKGIALRQDSFKA